jgi:hypothetical protein
MTELQNENGSATAPTVPSHGSINPRQETKMNSTDDSTGPAIALAPITYGMSDLPPGLRLLRIRDALSLVDDLAEAAHLATSGLNDDDEKRALHAITTALARKIEEAAEMVDEARRADQ